MNHVLGLRCAGCGKEFDARGMTYVCGACGKNLDVVYDYKAAGKTLTRAAPPDAPTVRSGAIEICTRSRGRRA